MKTRNVAVILIVTAAILAIPLVAMQFTDEVKWTPFDFVVAGVLLAGTGLLYEFASRYSSISMYRAGVAVALGSALFLVWANLAVGVIGREDNPANLMYLGVLGVGFIGAAVARFQPLGMARALLATAGAQVLVALIAAVAGMGRPWSGPVEILAVNALFSGLWILGAVLFRLADLRGHQPAGSRSRPGRFLG